MDDSVKHLFATAQDQSKKYSGPYRREFSKVASSVGQLGDAFAISGYSQEDSKLNEGKSQPF